MERVGVYLLQIYVTYEQEVSVKSLFDCMGWKFMKLGDFANNLDTISNPPDKPENELLDGSHDKNMSCDKSHDTDENGSQVEAFDSASSPEPNVKSEVQESSVPDNIVKGDNPKVLRSAKTIKPKSITSPDVKSMPEESGSVPADREVKGDNAKVLCFAKGRKRNFAKTSSESKTVKDVSEELDSVQVSNGKDTMTRTSRYNTRSSGTMKTTDEKRKAGKYKPKSKNPKLKILKQAIKVEDTVKLHDVGDPGPEEEKATTRHSDIKSANRVNLEIKSSSEKVCKKSKLEETYKHDKLSDRKFDIKNNKTKLINVLKRMKAAKEKGTPFRLSVPWIKKKGEDGEDVLCCKECTLMFKTVTSFKLHKRGDKCLFACEVCGETYPARKWKQYKEHLKQHQKREFFWCDPCGQEEGLDFRRRYIIHQECHGSQRPFSCDRCNRTFCYAQNLKRHKWIVHTKPERYQCHLCGLNLKSDSGFRQHLEITHSVNRPFECKTCHKCFKTKYAIRKHELTHEDVCKYVCEVCSKGWKTRSDLTQHQKRHKNERRFFCEVCFKGFYSKNELRIHSMIHTGEKPHKCNLCQYRCIQPGNLVLHMRNVHKIEKGRKGKMRKTLVKFDNSEESQTVLNNTDGFLSQNNFPQSEPEQNNSSQNSRKQSSIAENMSENYVHHSFTEENLTQESRMQNNPAQDSLTQSQLPDNMHVSHRTQDSVLQNNILMQQNNILLTQNHSTETSMQMHIPQNSIPVNIVHGYESSGIIVHSMGISEAAMSVPISHPAMDCMSPAVVEVSGVGSHRSMDCMSPPCVEVSRVVHHPGVDMASTGVETSAGMGHQVIDCISPPAVDVSRAVDNVSQTLSDMVQNVMGPLPTLPVMQMDPGENLVRETAENLVLLQSSPALP